MNFLTFYFSGSGNTKWSIDRFNEIIEEKGHKGWGFSVEKVNGEEWNTIDKLVSEADFIGFANPIYGANIPPIMRNFICKLTTGLNEKSLDSKRVYIINTMGYANTFGPFVAKKLFYSTKLELIAYVNILLCNNISTPKIKTHPIGDEKLRVRKENARRELMKMVEGILRGKKYIRGIGLYLLPGIIVRKKAEKPIKEHYKSLSVRNETCKKCMLCVEKCPTQSITFSNNEFEFLPTCTACMRCYNFCPSYSILMDGIYADPKIYVRYHGPGE